MWISTQKWRAKGTAPPIRLAVRRVWEDPVGGATAHRRPPGQRYRVGNVEFLARTVDTPRFTFGIIEIAPGRELEAHLHPDEDDAFYILEGQLTFMFDRRIGLAD
jgi:quercetin dioxygenase-like cupin family protein